MIEVTWVCQECGRRGTGHGYTKEEARIQLLDEGWMLTDHGTVCESCAIKADAERASG